MRYSYSAEVQKDILERLLLIERLVEECVSQRLDDPAIASIDLTIGYVPVILDDPLNRYPPRTKVFIKRRTLESAPKLDHDEFSKSSLRDAAKMYIDGLLHDLPLIREIGITNDEYDVIVQVFEGVASDVGHMLAAQ